MPCPRCTSPIENDAIACPTCKTIVRFLCESCKVPVLISARRCTACGAENADYDPSFDKDRDASGTGIASAGMVEMESEFDAQSADLAKEIAELKGELGKSEMVDAFSAASSNAAKASRPVEEQRGDDTAPGMIEVPVTDEAHLFIQSMTTTAGLVPAVQENPIQDVFSAWDCDVVVHSKNKQEPVHVGFGTDPWKARGVPGTIIFTQSAVIFVTYIPQIRNINDIFAYVAFDVGMLNDYHLDPDMSRNYLVFNSTGLFKKKFPGTLAINMHFTWSKEKGHDDVQNQMFQFKSLIERLKLFKVESHLLSGDYLFTQGKKPADNPEARDILQELKNIPAVAEIIKDRYPSLGKLCE